MRWARYKSQKIQKDFNSWMHFLQNHLTKYLLPCLVNGVFECPLVLCSDQFTNLQPSQWNSHSIKFYLNHEKYYLLKLSQIPISISIKLQSNMWPFITESMSLKAWRDLDGCRQLWFQNILCRFLWS